MIMLSVHSCWLATFCGLPVVIRANYCQSAPKEQRRRRAENPSSKLDFGQSILFSALYCLEAIESRVGD